MDYLNDAIRHVATWLNANTMSINVEKQRSCFLDLNKNNYQRQALLKLMTQLLRELNTSHSQTFTETIILRGKCIFTTFVQKFLKQQECYIKQGFTYLAKLFFYFIILQTIHILPTAIQYGILHIPQTYLLQNLLVTGKSCSNNFSCRLQRPW